MVYLKGAALFVMLLILAIEQSEGGVVGDCWESLSDCTNQNLDTGAGFLTCEERCVCLGYGKGRCVSHSQYTCRHPNGPYRCMCGLRRRGHAPAYCNQSRDVDQSYLRGYGPKPGERGKKFYLFFVMSYCMYIHPHFFMNKHCNFVLFFKVCSSFKLFWSFCG